MFYLCCFRLTLNLARRPLVAFDAHLDSSQTPILAVVVALAVDASARLCLVVREHRQHAKDDGDTRVELHAHQAVRHAVGNVLKVHRLALDQDADGNDGVEGAGRGSGGGGRLEVGRAGGEEVGGRGRARSGLLDLGGREKAVRHWSVDCHERDEEPGKAVQNSPLHGNRQLPRSRARLHHNVGLLDAALEKLGLCAGHEGVDDGGVPARVDDGDAEAGAVVLLRGRALEGRHCVVFEGMCDVVVGGCEG